ncbi:hypothetical protein BYT27DRAFT_7203603 [Phlegmacium glaucopus]|nr:hypothetical protein BYT27DRAFT_7203603 [Phlegmacium glaucopus]
MPLSSFHILDAFNRSSDGGATLFLSKLNVSEIGPAEALQLSNPGNHEAPESIVERLALGSNQLTTLPDEFTNLSRLRYLNLKHNSFSTFPDVLTHMPLLDTLDISHNKIKALPSRPGQLIHLRVLCLSRNKIRRLPAYFTQFRMLDVLQIDRNPLEWPPKSEIESCGGMSDINKSKEWIRNLQNWIEINSSTSQEYDDSGYSEQPRWGDDLNHTYDDWQFPIHQREFDAGVTPHARSLSVDSDTSILSITESSPKPDINGSNTPDQPLWVPHLSDTHTTGVGKIRGSRRVAEGLEMPSPTSLSANSSFEVLPDMEQMHLRADSYASTRRKPLPKSMMEKKSLPDLRMVHKVPTKNVPIPSEGRPPTTLHEECRTPEESLSHSPFRKDSDSSSGSASIHPECIQPSNALPSLTVDCTSYFRRSSTLNLNFLPKSLLYLLESARSILFAMSKLYQTLEHYAHNFDERLPSILKKSLDPANVNMSHLVRSLDRFDDFSQKARPSPAVCRALVESCRDVAMIMKKAVGLLILQIGSEPFNRRYSRWLILELHAVTTEIALAWQTMGPYVDSLRPFLYGSVFSNSSHNNLETLAGPISLLNSDQRLTPGVRLRPPETLQGGSGAIGTGRVRMARRHAGSFSSKDVQIGKELPSCDIFPTTMGRLTTHTPTLTTPKRQTTMPVFPTSTSTLQEENKLRLH